MESELETFFPSLGDSAKIKEYYTQLRKRTLLILDYIQGKTDQSEIDKIDDFLFSFSKPHIFHGSSGVETTHVRSFEQVRVLINQNVFKDTKQMTTVEFFQCLETIKQQHKQRKKNRKRPSRTGHHK